ncbi:hypothetical protein SAMN04490248_12220 [Salinihabitans flavidus]|uniref:DUF115 domain-containing protein n=1 Tax=Salinihabitans flavidus TaxID=569882 RepID=A0A1H8UTI5_9RHOB|nr:hypothetical protein [Salinihabitans flavidus]SEP06287.1 hypothetical protein SAMN04490248_12220 [Salinihabitans flavidus]
MPDPAGIVLILGSGPNAVASRDWDVSAVTHIVAINNAWRVRPDWSHLIHPEDFPPDRRPSACDPRQRIVTAADYVPVQNRYGGFVYAGGTMAFTAGYWALGALRPRVMAFIGCDMVYPRQGNTHFYGTGAADPLRDDITLQNLEAKSARLALCAAMDGCHCVNLSTGESRLTFPRVDPHDLPALSMAAPAPRPDLSGPLTAEATLGYHVPSGRYWEERDRFDAVALRQVDALWLSTHEARSTALT